MWFIQKNKVVLFGSALHLWCFHFDDWRSTHQLQPWSPGAWPRHEFEMRRWDFLNWEDEKMNFLRLIWEKMRIWDENFSNLRRFFASSISFSRNGQKSSQSKLFGKLYCQKDPKRSKGCFWFLEYWLFMIVPSKPWVCTVDIFKISIKSCCQVVNYDKTSWSSSKLAIRPDRCHHHGLRLCQTPGASLGDKKVELKLSLGVLAWFNRGKLLERYVWQDTAWAALSLSSDLGQHQMKKNYLTWSPV